MRKCRKMISVIMLMVMLVSLLPSGALAAEAPTGATNEVAAVEEPEKGSEEANAAVSNENSVDEVVADGSGGEEATSEETAERAAIPEEMANEEETSEEAAAFGATEKEMDEPSTETAAVVEPETKDVQKEEKAAGETDLETYLNGRGGSLSFTLYKKDSNGIWQNMNKVDGKYVIDDKNGDYKIAVSINAPYGIAEGAYTYPIDVTGAELSLIDGDNRMTFGDRDFGSYSVSGHTVTANFENSDDLQGIKMTNNFYISFKNTPDSVYRILNGTVEVKPAEGPYSTASKSGVLDKENKCIYWTAEIKNNNGSNSVGTRVEDFITIANFGRHFVNKDYGVVVTATGPNNETVTWNAAKDDSANFEWAGNIRFYYTIPEGWGSYTFGPYWNFKFVYKSDIESIPGATETISYYNTIRGYNGDKYVNVSVPWQSIGVGINKDVSVDSPFQTAKWTITADYSGLSATDHVSFRDGWRGWKNSAFQAFDSSVKPDPENMVITLKHYVNGKLVEEVIPKDRPSTTGGRYYTLEYLPFYDARGFEIRILKDGEEGRASGIVSTSDQKATITIKYDTAITEELIHYMRDKKYWMFFNWVNTYVNENHMAAASQALKFPQAYKTSTKASEATNHRATFDLVFAPAKDGEMESITLVDEHSRTVSVDEDTIRIWYSNVDWQNAIGSYSYLMREHEIFRGQDWTSSYKDKVLTITINNPKRYHYHIQYEGVIATLLQDAVPYDNSFYVEDEEKYVYKSHDEMTDFKVVAETYKASLVKNDENGSPLKGAEIGLYTQLDNLMKTENTGEDGKASFITSVENDVIYSMNRPYYLQEISAPKGYVLDSTKKWFVFLDEEAEGNSSETYWKQYFADKGVKEADYQIVDANKKSTGSDTENHTLFETGEFTLVNVPEDIQLTVNKKWDDLDNVDNTRPTSITVQLLANKEAEGDPVTINGDDNGKFSYTWTGLKKNDAEGNAIEYSVSETKVSGYDNPVIGEAVPVKDAEGNVTGYTIEITNSLAPKTQVSVQKVWDDFNDEAKKRPTEIKVQLKAGSDNVGGQVTLNKDNEWSYTWENLPKYAEDGKTLIDYKVDEVAVPDGYTKNVSGDATTGYTITNSYMPKINIPVEKIWDDVNDQDRIRPASIQVQLTANGKNVGSPVTLDTNNSWKYTWTNMPKYADGKVITYRVVESSVPDGYQVSYSGDVTNGFKVTNSHKHDVVSVSVEKIWNDFDDEAGARPKSITVQLLAGTEVVEDSQVTLDGTVDDIEKTAWQYTWENLPKNKDGKPIEYKVDEVSVPDGYTKTLSGDATTGYKITNNYMPKTNISVKKVWDDKNDQDRVRPASITVYLVKDGKEVEGSRVILDGTVDSIETTAWNYVWTNLDKYTAEGDEIKYSVEEDADAMPEGYSCRVTEEGNEFTITNKYSPDTTDVAVKKVWDDSNDHDKFRPESITVKLFADGTEVPNSQVTLDGTVDEKEKTAWSYTWENLDKNKDGKPIEYTVDEVEVPDKYQKTISTDENGSAEVSYIITNKYEPRKTSKIVAKVWKDNDNQDGIRPESITVQLLANGVVVEGSQVVLDGIPDEDPNLEYVSWYHRWGDLDYFDENGKEITYTVDEVDVPEGYELSTYQGTPASVLTNTHEPYKTEVSVKKVWDDDENRDRVRPESITVKLLADGVEVPNSQVTLDGTVDEKEETAWSYTWKELDKNNAGKAIVYTVDEVEVPEGYTKSLSGDAETGYTITNTHNNDLTEVSVEKIWDDAKDQDGIRPESITVQLFANGEPVDGSQVTLDGSTDDDETAPWFHTWKNLNKNEAGEEIEYTVDEVEVPEGYTKEISGDAKVGYKITNTHKERAVSISKVDAASMEEVKDAHIQVIDAKGAVFDEWTSTDDGKPHVVHGLTPGETYTLHETVEPLGYTIASDTTFSVDEDGKVTSSGTVTEGNVVLVKDTLTKVHVRKVDAANDKELPGATLQILDKNNEVKYEWTSTEEDYVVTGLTAGEEYTLVETVAPLGFTVTSKTTFTVDNKNKVTSTGTVSATSDGTPVLLVKDTMTVVKISKTDITGDKELKGATLQILDENGNVVTVKDHDGNDVKCEWVSTDKPHVVEGLEIDKTYTLREKTAPDGFIITADATFRIDKNNRITTEIPKNSAGVLLVKDEPTKVKVSKVDITGEKELQGATLQILDAEEKVVEIKDNDGNVVETCEWVSAKEPKDIVGLKTGVVYTLRETIAPDGYTIATDFQFTIAADGKVTCTGKTTTAEDGTTVLLVEDAPTKVYISKTDINSGDELPGATMQILDEEENVIVIKDNDGNPVETLEWVSGEEPKYIEGLPTGVNYILRETISPDGYTIASDTKFTIDEKGVVTSDGTTSVAEDGTTVLVVEDDLTTVQISKVDAQSEKELEGAKLQIIDEENNIVEEWISTKEVHVVRGLVANKKYILREQVAPLGYTLTTDTTFSIDMHNVVTSTGPVNKDGVILVNDTMTEVEILKVDSKTGKGLAGAKLQVLDDNGAVCDEWKSTKDAHKIRGLYTGVKYTLHEVEAPKGYDKAKDITFTIDTAGKVSSDALDNGKIVMKDTPTPKKNKTGDEANGSLWALLLMMASGALGGAVWFKRKRRV